MKYETCMKVVRMDEKPHLAWHAADLPVEYAAPITKKNEVNIITIH